jgi:hypothetical protein
VNNREQATRREINTIRPIPVDAGPVYYWLASRSLAGRSQARRAATA